MPSESRDRVRAHRARNRKAEQGDVPPVPRPFRDPVRWLNQSIKVFPWESRWLRAVLADGILYGSCAISRGNGKTTFAGAVAASAIAPGGPLYVEGTAVILVAASFGQAREGFEATQEILDPWIRAEPDDWRVLDGQRLLIEHRPTRTKLEVRGSEARTLHGIRKGRLFICDEPAQWQANMRDRLWSAIRTSLGKVEGARCLLIGTRPDSEDHFFSRMLRGGPATIGMSWHAERDDDPFAKRTWTKANPSLKYLPALRQVIEVEAQEARQDSSLLPGFKALRLNMGTADHEIQSVLTAGTWERIELLPDGEPIGGWVLGMDLGSSAAMSAASAYYWRSGYLRSFAMFADTPSLEDRGAADHVGTLYERMAKRGELCTTPGRIVKVDLLLREVVERWGLPAAIIADRFRKAELLEGLTMAEWPVLPLVLRGMGYRDGSEDLRAFRKACLNNDVIPEVSLLLRSAMAEAVAVSDLSGNSKLAKGTQGGRRQLARDDACAAAILAVAQGVRRRHKDEKSGTVKLRIVA